METKTFLIALGVVLTFVILGGIWIIANSISEQSRIQFEQQQNRSYNLGNNSVIIHDALYNNITELKKGLDPILDQIPNATKAQYDQQLHYNQTAEDFTKIERILDIKLVDHETLERVLEIKLEDHETLSVMNQSLVKIIEILNSTSGTANGTIIPVPIPIVVVENVTEDPIINNVTEQEDPIIGPIDPSTENNDDRGLSPSN